MLMRPDAVTNESFIYCLAVAAEKYQIDVLFTVAMSNHHHTGIVDNHGNFPAFLEYFHKFFAKCMNAHRGRWANFWSSEQTNAVRLVSPEALLDKLIYSVCNPVKAGLVERAKDWPGVSSLKEMLGCQKLSAKRPEHFFRPNGGIPKEATLRFVRPPGFEHLSKEEWCQLLRERVAQREKQHRGELSALKRRVLGVRKVERQAWWQRPKSKEPRRKLVPQVASKNKWRRIEALLQNRSFLSAYKSARTALKAGTTDVLCPPGTYWLARFASIACVAS